MRKKIVFIFITTFSLYAQEKYTFVFSNVESISNADLFIEEYLKDKESVKIVPYQGRYRITYGEFINRKEAYHFKKSLPLKLKNFNPFIISIKEKNIDNKPVTIKTFENSNLTTEKENVKVINIHKKESNVEINTTNKIEKIREKDDFNIGLNFEYALQKNKETFVYGTESKIQSKDLGMNENTNSFVPTIYIRNKNHKVYISYFYEDNSFNESIQNDINFDGYIYSANSKLNIKENTKWLTSGYRYSLDYLSFGVDIHNYKSKLNFTSNTNSGDLKKDYIFPSLSLDINHKINRVLFNAGSSYGMKSNELDYYTYYFGLGIDNFIFNNTSLNFGYKNKTIDIKEDKYDGKKEYTGMYMNINKEF